MDDSTLIWRVVLHSFADKILHSFADDSILVEDGPIDDSTLLMRVVMHSFVDDNILIEHGRTKKNTLLLRVVLAFTG